MFEVTSQQHHNKFQLIDGKQEAKKLLYSIFFFQYNKTSMESPHMLTI